MARPTSTTDQRRVLVARRRLSRGFSLVEGMVASVLLAGCVVGVTGTLLSAMAHDEYSREQAAAIRSGSQAMDELAALPLDSADASRVSLSDFANFSDTTNTQVANAIVPTMAALKASGGSTSAGAGGLISDLATVVGDTVHAVSGGSAISSEARGGSASVATTQPSSTSYAKRRVSIDRRSSLGGTASTAGDFATVTVAVQAGNGQTYQIKRLITAAEAQSNAR